MAKLLVLTIIAGSLFVISSGSSGQDSLGRAYAQAGETNGGQTDEQTRALQETVVYLKDLLNFANIEYIDAVIDGEIKSQEQYDEAVFYAQEALNTFEGIRQNLSAIAPEQTLDAGRAIDRVVTLIENNDDSEVVSETMRNAKQKLDEILMKSGAGIQPIDGWAYVDSIKSLLDQMLDEYAAGSFDKARVTAREAYLYNFEFIREDIAEENSELVDSIDSRMRVDLVNMIDNRRPAVEIEAHADQIKTDLEQAKAILTPEFPLAIPALMIMMTFLVFVTGRLKRGTLSPSH